MDIDNLREDRVVSQMGEKIDIQLTREFIQLIGIDPDKLVKMVEEDEQKSNVHCFLFHQLKQNGKFNCPWPSQCVHRQ